ncbi:MAG TPA: hypothetical protein VEB61_05850 [Candidatus Binatia bacterium]|nr:hypothetical protein [Candidatus Binatia bacterium]
MVKVLEKIESDLGTTATASHPAMLWKILSQLERRGSTSGYGRLLAE